MAAGSLLTLLDDIASILDDVSLLTKRAAAKTAGVLGDDLALNAEQVSGVVADRELPVVWAVAKGSFINKLILVPLALTISHFAPWAVIPLLMVGGLYLCFEGCEKLAHHFFHRKTESDVVPLAKLAAAPEDAPGESEADRIKGAVRTDFVLSAEIITIALGIVANQDFTRQLLVLSAVAMIMTVGVYGLVAGIVKLDDAGLYLTKRSSNFSQMVGRAILVTAPWLMKLLSIAGTAAMFLVGGGIVTHGIPWLHHFIDHTAASVKDVGGVAAIFSGLIGPLINGAFGLVAGTLVLLAVVGIRKLRNKPALPTH